MIKNKKQNEQWWISEINSIDKNEINKFINKNINSKIYYCVFSDNYNVSSHLLSAKNDFDLLQTLIDSEFGTCIFFKELKKD